MPEKPDAWWMWEHDEEGVIEHAHRRDGRSRKALCGIRLDPRACYTTGNLPRCPVCLAASASPSR